MVRHWSPQRARTFATHSNAESELVSYCEALTAGRATEALLCVMLGEPLSNNNRLE